jgi:O-antigen/teichoic acid export membrane protein
MEITLRKFLKNTLALFGGQVVIQFSTLLLGVMIARKLGQRSMASIL